MSNDSNDAAAKPKSEVKPPKKNANTRRQKWRRRFFVFVTTLVLLGMALRLLVHVLFPIALDRVARSYGLAATYDKLDLSVLGGDVGIWGLKFTPVEGGSPVLTASYCRGVISTWKLLQLKLQVQRAEAEDAELVVERLADGSLPLLQKLVGNATTTVTAPAKAQSTSEASLDAPLRIDALRLQNARARLRDAMVSPATDVTLALDLLVKDVGSPDRRTNIEMQLNSPEALAALYVNAVGQSRQNQIDADLDIKMVGLDLGPAEAYLAPLGIKPISHDISARATGKLTLSLASPAATQKAAGQTPPQTAAPLHGSLVLSNLALTADAIQSAGVKQVSIDASEISPGAVRLSHVTVAGVHANAARAEGGLIRFAGIEIGGTPSPATMPVTRLTPMAAIATTKPAVTPTVLPIAEINQLDITDVAFAFDDRAVRPASRIELTMPALRIQNLSTDPAKASTPATLTLDAAAPGIMNAIHAAGTIAAATPTKTASITVHADGVTGAALKPYLEPLGVESELKSGTFDCHLDASVNASATGVVNANVRLADVKLADAGHDLFGMPLVGLTDASFDPATNAANLKTIELRGPTLPIVREHDGSIRAFGFHYTMSATVNASPVPTNAKPGTPSSPAATAAPLALPPLALGKFTWREADIELTDRSTANELKIPLNNITADLNHLSFGRADATPGAVAFAVRSPGIIDQFDMKGSVTPGQQSVAFDLKGDGSGLTLEALRPLLVSLKLDPQLHAGVVRFHTMGDVAIADGKVNANLSLEDAALVDGDDTWIGVGGATAGGVSFDGSRLTVAQIVVKAPTLLVTRDEKGQPTAAGIRILTALPAVPVVDVSAPTSQPVTPTRVDLSLPIVADLRSLTVEGANLRLHDASVLPKADITATADATLSNLIVGDDAPPATFEANAAVRGLVDRVSVNGTIKLAPAEQAFNVAVTAAGLTGKSIEPYFPPTIGLDLAGRSASVKASVVLKPNADGGSAAEVTVTDAALTQPNAAADLALGHFHLAATRLDWPAQIVALDDLSIAGIQASAQQDASGLHVAGVTLAPAPLRDVPPAPPYVEPIAAAGATNVDRLVRQSQETLPLITLAHLSIGVDRATFTTPALGEPLVLHDVTLTNTSPIEVGGKEAADRNPIDVAVRAGVNDLVEQFRAAASIAPFATEPMAHATIDATGLHGGRLTSFVPALADLLNGQDLEDAAFYAAADARFGFSRRGPLGIDLTRDVTAEVALKDVRLTAANTDRPLVGVAEVRADHMRFSPASGDISVQSLDIEKPIASVTRKTDGVHVAGITLNLLKPTAAPTTEPATQEIAAAASETPATAVTLPASAPTSEVATNEIKIDRLTMTGLDFVLTDEVNSPYTVIPVTDLDVEVTGLSTRALREPLPLRFSAVVAAGKVPLPPRKTAEGVESEMREAFSEASASGNLTLFPKPKGYVRASLSGLEMTAIRGIAKEFGITLGGGTFDARLDVRMQGADTFEAKVYPTFNELRMSEVSDGPVQKTFKLPAPPDVVISTIEDADGSLSFPITVPIEAGKVEVGPIVASAAGSVAKVVAEAMVAAPLKAGKLLGGLAGFDMSSDRTRGLEPVTFDFAPGETQLDDAQIAALKKLQLAMRRDPTIEVTIQHELGDDDVTKAGTRVNPGEEDAAALAERLRSRKFELQRRHAEEAATLRFANASQSVAARDEAASRLRSNDAELKLTEDALDEALDLVRPGSDRQAPRRTKAAAILLADLRLRAVQDWLIATGLPDAANRVRKGNAIFNPQARANGRITIALTRAAKQ